MSNHTQLSSRADLLHQLNERPEICVRALESAHDLPRAKPDGIEPVDLASLGVYVRGQAAPLRPDLAWFADFGRTGLVVAIVADRFEPADLWRWPCLRAGLRLALRCPTWLMVFTTSADLATAIETAFADQPDLMPIVSTLTLVRPSFAA